MLRSGNLVSLSLAQSQNKEAIATLVRKKRVYLVSDRGLAAAHVDARIRQYCLAHLLRNIQELAEHPSTILEETARLGELHDGIPKQLEESVLQVRGFASNAIWAEAKARAGAGLFICFR